MLVCARLQYVAGSNWGVKRYTNMDHLMEMYLEREDSMVGQLLETERSKLNMRNNLDTTQIRKGAATHAGQSVELPAGWFFVFLF